MVLPFDTMNDTTKKPNDTRPAKPRKWPLLEHGDGAWHWSAERSKIELRHTIDGTRYVERADTCDECIVKRNRRRRDIQLAALPGEALTVIELIEDWIAYQGPARNHKTEGMYEWSLAKIRPCAIAEVTATEVKSRHVYEMGIELVAAGLGSASVIRVRSHLNMALTYGVERYGYPDGFKSMVRGAKMPEGAPRYRAPKWFEIDDYQTVREYLYDDPSPRHALFLTMLQCGLRVGEAAGLKWRHVDLDRGTLSVEGMIERGRGSKDRERYTTRLKTDHCDGGRNRHAHRTIQLHPDLIDLLAKMQVTSESEFVFSEGGKWVRLSIMHDIAVEIAKESGVKFVNPTGYRHTFASVCLSNGMTYIDLAPVMGHKDATMLIQTYGHSVKGGSAMVETAAYL